MMFGIPILSSQLDRASSVIRPVLQCFVLCSVTFSFLLSLSLLHSISVIAIPLLWFSQMVISYLVRAYDSTGSSRI